MEGNLNILADNFNPHGLTVDWNKNVILTSDFIVPVTILKPTLGKISDNTLRLWNLSARKIISTITIPNVMSLRRSKIRSVTLIHFSFQGGGIQDVKFIPGNSETAALATAVHLGQVGFLFLCSFRHIFFSKMTLSFFFLT